MELSVQVHAVIRCKYRPVSEPPALHTHGFYQLVCVALGRGWLAADGETYTVREGDVFLLAPGVPHSPYALRGESMTTYELKFEAKEPLASLLVGVPPRILGGAPRVRELLSLAAEEGRAKRPHYRELIALSVESALYLLVRGNSAAMPTSLTVTAEEEAPLLFRIRSYLDQNLDAKITLDLLASQFAVSREHLCRRFSEVFGTSPMRYLNARRHERACALLVGTDMTVTEIAAATGYATVHYFSRAFRNAEGISPAEYRLGRRDNIVVDLK